jgi:multidrug efflux system outer membrane protein
LKKLLPLLLLAGCIKVGPDYTRPDVVPLPAAYPAESAPGDAVIPADWWLLYSDATLNDLVASTRKANADIRLAAARVQEAEAVLREARAALWPDVGAGYNFSRSRVSTSSIPAPPAGTQIRPSHSLVLASTSYELDFWGRYARLSEAAQANLLSSRLSQDTVGLTLAGATAQTYFALRSLDSQVQVLDISIQLRQESLLIARARLDAGLASELDVYQAEGALADALFQRRDAARNRALVERQLAQLTGRLDLKLAAGEVFSLPLPPVPPAGLPSTLLERRPDIRAAEQSLVSANAQIGVARAAMFPTISLTGSLGFQSAEFGNLLQSGSQVWSVGAGLLAPIFDAGRRAARVEQTEARREQAVAGYQRAIETGFREVADALVNVQESAQAEDELRGRLDAARKALELSRLRYESGYSPYLEVLDAQRTANDAAITFVRNRQARLAFSVDLMKALGGGWTARN